MMRIQATIPASPIAHLDEAGRRENGVNGYAWACSTPEAAHFARRSRAAAMVERLVGTAFSGVVASDSYAGYALSAGVKQECWAKRTPGSMLRDLHDLRLAHSENAAVQGWAAKMVCASLFGTWRKRDENPYDVCRALVLSPQL